MTYADIALFSALVPAFQLALDAGFRKAMPHLSEWFAAMSKEAAVVRHAGHIKCCDKPIK